MENKNKFWTAKNIILVLVLFIILLATVELCILYFEKNYLSENFKTAQINQTLPKFAINTDVPVKAIAPKPGTYFVMPKSAVSDLGAGIAPKANAKVEWLGGGKKLPDLKLILNFWDDYNPVEQQYYQPISYYEMGSRGTSKIILAVAPLAGLGGTPIFFFEQNANGYVYMAKMSSGSVYGDGGSQGYLFSPSILSADTNTFYNGIVGDASISWKGLNLENGFGNSPGDLFENYLDSEKQRDNIKVTKVDMISSLGDLYLERMTTAPSPDFEAKFYVQRYILKLPSGFYTPYYAKYDLFSDNSVPNIIWNDGSKNTDPFNQDAKMGGCGGSGGYAISSADVSGDILSTGKTGKGEAIYEFKDANNPIVKLFYSYTEGKVYDNAGNTTQNLSLSEWNTKHAVILYKNSLGEYVIFTNDKYGLQAECAKPVIYLYPEKTVNIKVKVGAKITKSEPVYNNGWQVTASPNGKIINSDNKVYDSLFWDGIGNGPYPEIKDGFIVEQKNLKDVIATQLKELGLNAKESSDFMDFWLSKMPNTPYVRLTWFTTEQMNKLAPLAISPRPDTVIRIFLDFKGLENKINLPKQKLFSQPRKGFTVVEWGGLLVK